MTFRGVMAAISAGARDLDTLDDLARAALAEGEEERALQLLLPAAERSQEALLWQWIGLLQRSLDEHEAANASFARAVNANGERP